MSVITTNKALESFCRSLERADFIALDTEFIRENTYYPKLCLIQIAGSKEAAAIDPLAKDIDLAPFFALLTNKKLLKVMHAARQDVEIFYNLTGKVPAPMFDTQIAAMVCGYGESVGYEPLASKLAGASIDKSQRFTDWARRPLSERQIEYALSDVIHLRPVYEKLVKQIEAEGRMAWIEEEMSGLYDITRYETDPAEMWQRLKYRSRSPRFLATLRELAKWRELEARQLNIPRGRVIKDESLVELAGAAPKTLEELQKIRGFPSGLSIKRKQTLLDIIDAARNLNLKDCPQLEHKKPLPEGTSALVELLKVLLRMKSEEHGVASRLIASKEDLEAMATGNFENLPAMSGWRYEVFGQQAEALMKGKIALSSDPKSHMVKLRAIG